MIDVKEPLRTAYYQALNGNLTWNAATVPVVIPWKSWLIRMIFMYF